MGAGREAGCCELLWFATDPGRDEGLKGEGEPLWTAQMWVLLICIFFPFPGGQTGQVPPLCMWGG